MKTKTLNELEKLDAERPKNTVAEAYKKAEKVAWAKLQDFQKEAIEEARKDPNRDDHIFKEFAAEVDQLVNKYLKE